MQTLLIQLRESGDRQTLKSNWPGSLSNLVNSNPMRDSGSKLKVYGTYRKL